MELLIRDNQIWFGEEGNSKPRRKRFLKDVRQGIVPQTIWKYDDVGHTQEAKQELLRILGASQSPFATPKPIRLITRILQIATNPGDIVLDSFAGSGTTAHAILYTNKQDNGDRRFILVEMESDIAHNITAERLKRVMQGYTWHDQKGNERYEEGLRGGFSYCELGPTLFNAQGQIRTEVGYKELAQHVFFTETGEPLPDMKTQNGPLLGTSKGVGVYLLYNGVLKDKTPQGGNVLNRSVLSSLPKHDGPKVIYGTGCLLSEPTLQQLSIIFRQIPYEVKVS